MRHIRESDANVARTSSNGGVVHGRGFQSLTFGVNGGVVHGCGFESLTFGESEPGSQWWCSACRGFESLSFRGSSMVV
jgi:hypothetical protein